MVCYLRDILLARRTLEHLDNELEKASLPKFVREQRSLIKGILDAISGDRVRKIEDVTFTTIPNCQSSFASQIFMVCVTCLLLLVIFLLRQIQQLVLQFAKLLQPANAAWASTQNTSYSAFGTQKILLFSHNLGRWWLLCECTFEWLTLTYCSLS